MADRAHQLMGGRVRFMRLPPDHVFTVNDLEYAKNIVRTSFRRLKPNSLEDISHTLSYSDPHTIHGVNDPTTRLLEALALTTKKKWVLVRAWKNGYSAWNGDVVYAYTEEGWKNSKYNRK